MLEAHKLIMCELNKWVSDVLPEDRDLGVTGSSLGLFHLKRKKRPEFSF